MEKLDEIYHYNDDKPIEGWIHRCIFCEKITGNVVVISKYVIYICKSCIKDHKILNIIS
uniref:ClpX-type ZB domain-containing protein n=1 Tax=viral metagenome TaxID=1070528 RepID=A0A6C0F977_9ZZZZ